MAENNADREARGPHHHETELTASGGLRETFASNFGLLMTMIGVAVGLGNVWRFPYMTGKYGGAAFLVFYLFLVLVIGIPALMSEWALGRHTRRGTVGAFFRGGFPYGRYVGWFFFFIVTAATAYYTNAIGWVVYYAVGEITSVFGGSLETSAILPPEEGFVLKSFLLQLLFTGLVIFFCAVVLIKGLRRGIEWVSKVILPLLFIILVILAVRSITLEGAGEGLDWYIFNFKFSNITGSVMAAALGQAIFSLSLGGTFMVVYGSYLNKQDNLPRNAIYTAIGDTTAGVLAGLAIFPAVFAFGLDAASGPGLIFFTLPEVFAQMPVGWLFGLLFFVGLAMAAYLSDVAAFEVLVAGITDNTKLKRTPAVLLMSGIVFLFAIPPMINMNIFEPWDLTFGSGMQTLGSLLAVVTLVWFVKRSDALKELAVSEDKAFPMWLYYWMRFVIPIAILTVGVWWFLTSVLGVVEAA